MAVVPERLGGISAFRTDAAHGRSHPLRIRGSAPSLARRTPKAYACAFAGTSAAASPRRASRSSRRSRSSGQERSMHSAARETLHSAPGCRGRRRMARDGRRVRVAVGGGAQG
eukprot:1191606-Pleurochrysis_carterae.AAC.3